MEFNIAPLIVCLAVIFICALWIGFDARYSTGLPIILILCALVVCIFGCVFILKSNCSEKFFVTMVFILLSGVFFIIGMAID